MSEKPSILIVEDDEAGRAMLAEVLKLSGYDVLEASDCEEARQMTRKHHPDIAILDILLPDGDGIDFMSDLRNLRPSVIMIVSTRHGALQTAMEALNHGAYAYLLKPCEPQSMLSVIRHAEEKWRLEKRNRALDLQSQAEAKRVKALLKASEEINASIMDTAEMTRRIVQSAVEIMKARAGFIGLLSEDKIRANEWWDGSDWHPVFWEFAKGAGASGYVWHHHRTYASQDVLNDPILLPRIVNILRQTTMICCPILTRHGDFLGALDLSDKNGGEPFTESDAKFLEGLCRHVAVALENNLLYEERRRLEERQKQFYRDVVSAATRNKLILCELREMTAPPKEPALRRAVSLTENLASIRLDIAQIVRGRGMSEERCDYLKLCVGEAVTNALKHGGGGEIYLWLNDDHLLIRVEDHGPGIDATTLPKAALLPGYSTKSSLGMGLTIILEFVDQLRLHTSPSGTLMDMQISWHPRVIDPLDAFGLQTEL